MRIFAPEYRVLRSAPGVVSIFTRGPRGKTLCRAFSIDLLRALGSRDRKRFAIGETFRLAFRREREFH